MSATIRVVIDHNKFWEAAKRHDVHMNIAVLKTLRDRGIPVMGGIELRGVEHGRLTTYRDEDRDYVYEWTPAEDSPVAQQVAAWDDEDDDL